MNVRIVTAPKTTGSDILLRLARQLADGTGWSLDTVPDPKADAQLWFPYILMDTAWHRTPVAAEFSHRDDSIRGKAKLWDDAAQAADLRVTWAARYAEALRPHGPTRIATVPLDREKFSPGPNQKRPKLPVVGVSGYVPKGGRKGEALVKALMQSPLSERIMVVASGRGWPAPTREYPWNRLQEFYRGLDVYLCTALVEGVPYPPLEALATGVPIVIPRGVGLLDELPAIAGVHRYDAGDLASLVAALDESLDGRPDPEQLRALTERFTAAAWCEDHALAVAEMLGSDPVASSEGEEEDEDQSARILTISPAPEQPVAPLTAGVYCVAYGKPARDCAKRLVASLRRHMPGLPVAIASDTPLGAGEDVFVQNADEDLGARSVKTKMYALAPAEWDLVAYLDSDTELVAPIDALFAPLRDGWDLVICPNPARYALVRDGKRPDNTDELAATITALGSDELMQWGGGVLAFRRSERTAAFCRAWWAEWNVFGKRDQFALLRALWKHPLRVWVLGRPFNATDRYDETVGADVAIEHHHLEARRWKGIVKGRLNSAEAMRMRGEVWASLHPSREEAMR